MGMFDRILWGPPLPDWPPEYGHPTGQEWQTKDLECGLDTYAVTDEGLLIRQPFLRDGQIRVEAFVYPFTGTLVMYASVPQATKAPRGGQIYYRATFKGGQLQEVHRDSIG